MPQLKVEQGIQAEWTIFGKCFFDAEKFADAAPSGNTGGAGATFNKVCGQ